MSEREERRARVVHWGTGNTGTMGLKGILEHPDLELVGCFVARPERAGEDAGELVGRPRVGVTTTNDVDELLAIDADCLSYFGAGRDGIADVTQFLAAGRNVVTTSLASLILARFAPEEQRAPVQEACRAGNTSLFATGVEPGIASDLLPETLLSLVDEVDCIHVTEIAIYRHAGGASMRMFGFGIPAGEPVPLFAGGAVTGLWGQVVHHLAGALGKQLDSIELKTDTFVTDRDVEQEFGSILSGRIAAIRFQVIGMYEGEPLAIVEHVSRTAYDQAPDWPYGAIGKDTVYTIDIQGRPPLRCELDLPNVDGEDSGLVSTAMRAVNAIPAVVGAPAGILDPMDVPPRPSRKVRLGHAMVRR
jgi:2,4-diaminopentanoate dehydrogenase